MSNPDPLQPALPARREARSPSPSTVSNDVLRQATRSLASDAERDVNQWTRLLPVETCHAVIAACGDDRTPPLRATRYAREILACYPTMKPHDVDGYTAKLTECLQAFPEEIVATAVHPQTGIVALSRFPPSIAEVAAFLKEPMERRRSAGYNARRHLAERDRRAKAATEEAERPPLEERRKQVEAVMRRFAEARDMGSAAS